MERVKLVSVSDLTPACPSDDFHNRETSHVSAIPLIFVIITGQIRLLSFSANNSGIITLQRRRTLSIPGSVCNYNCGEFKSLW